MPRRPSSPSSSTTSSGNVSSLVPLARVGLTLLLAEVAQGVLQGAVTLWKIEVHGGVEISNPEGGAYG